MTHTTTAVRALFLGLLMLGLAFAIVLVISVTWGSDPHIQNASGEITMYAWVGALVIYWLEAERLC